jgi:ABC-type multidrug transport system fused ATPase/permease subunit
VALHEIDLAVNPGMKIALVGSSGAGKTTMAMLLMRFYDPDAGSILVDDIDLRKLNLEWYRKHIGVVFQDPFLFMATVRENIAMGNPEADNNDIVRAAIAANALDFINELPDGFDTIIGERGVTLSGGQQQRLAIARAILKDPLIVIFDEATSALDA